MSNKQVRFRPLITSLAFNNQNSFLPLKYNYTFEQIEGIKKYSSKNLFKIYGIDVDQQGCTLSKEDEEKLQKLKLKIKAVKGKFIENKKQVQFVPKQQVKVIQWYSKYIDLRIPYSSKDPQVKIQATIFQHVNYYLQNYMYFKNTLTQQLYLNDSNFDSLKLTADQLATETDIVFTNWNIQPEPIDTNIKIISINLPIILCLQLKESYSLKALKQLLKADLSNSISILLKHNFNTRVVFVAEGQKQFICFNSYCNEQNALKQEDKLRAIIKQNKNQNAIVQTQQSRNTTKKENKFLILILASLVLIYVLLKIFPIHSRDENLFSRETNNSPIFQDFKDNITNGQQIF